MPPLKTTLGQLMVNSALPEDLRDFNRVLDKKGVANLMQQVAEKYPERYREISKRVSDVGRDAAFTTGGTSVGLSALRPTVAGRRAQHELRQKLAPILNNPSLDPATRNKQIVEVVGGYQKQLLEDVYEESKADQNPLAEQLMGAGRGNKFTLNSLRGADLLYADHRGDPIPIPILRNYSQGLTPAEYFAGAFGARKGILDLKNATQDAGFFAKQLNQVNHRLLVSQLDDEEEDTSGGYVRGFPVETDDPDNAGALLAQPVGGYQRNTVLTPKILKELRNHGIKDILVRSPVVGGPGDGGVYARDVGVRERGGLSPVGDYVGLAAAQSLSEPVTQASISSKHSGGVAGASAGAIGGFKAINALVQVPKHFPGGAAHAQLDGRVHNIREASQGGHYVTVGNKDHYVPAGADLRVKLGDEIEAGDVLSAGTPNPAEIVRHKGIGEGRRYFVNAFRQTLRDSGTFGDRRNIELLSRGLINHVRLDDEIGDWVPEDVVPYSTLERQWQPRPGSAVIHPTQARGQYLERPVLHYSIGTKIGRSVLDNLQRYGVNQVEAHKEPPPFQPEMIRGMASVAHDPDWLVRMLGSYQQKSLLSGVHRGAVSDTNSTSFVPSLAEGTDFGLKGPTKGWQSP